MYIVFNFLVHTLQAYSIIDTQVSKYMQFKKVIKYCSWTTYIFLLYLYVVCQVSFVFLVPPFLCNLKNRFFITLLYQYTNFFSHSAGKNQNYNLSPRTYFLQSHNCSSNQSCLGFQFLVWKSYLWCSGLFLIACLRVNTSFILGTMW